jgi:hypothetical protein
MKRLTVRLEPELYERLKDESRLDGISSRNL